MCTSTHSELRQVSRVRGIGRVTDLRADPQEWRILFEFTYAAADLIRSLNCLPGPESGLRISIDPEWGSLNLSMADGPHQNDEVFRRDEVNVFVSESAMGRVKARTLDARTGNARAFLLIDRTGR
jgi:Fe-S cluster assembly iron-binding protein IscA